MNTILELCAGTGGTLLAFLTWLWARRRSILQAADLAFAWAEKAGVPGAQKALDAEAQLRKLVATHPTALGVTENELIRIRATWAKMALDHKLATGGDIGRGLLATLPGLIADAVAVGQNQPPLPAVAGDQLDASAIVQAAAVEAAKLIVVPGLTEDQETALVQRAAELVLAELNNRLFKPVMIPQPTMQPQAVPGKADAPPAVAPVKP